MFNSDSVAVSASPCGPGGAGAQAVQSKPKTRSPEVAALLIGVNAPVERGGAARLNEWSAFTAVDQTRPQIANFLPKQQNGALAE